MELLIKSAKFGEHKVLIDDDDFECIKKYKWHINYHNKNVYATTVMRVVDAQGKAKVVTYKMHRMIMGFPKEHIDHIDGNGLNNKKSNLRLASIGQNTKSKKGNVRNKSGYKGVVLHKKDNKYQVSITSDGKTYYSCGHTDIIEAAKKYNELALKYHGDFAFLNIIPNE